MNRQIKQMFKKQREKIIQQYCISPRCVTNPAKSSHNFFRDKNHLFYRPDVPAYRSAYGNPKFFYSQTSPQGSLTDRNSAGQNLRMWDKTQVRSFYGSAYQDSTRIQTNVKSPKNLRHDQTYTSTAATLYTRFNKPSGQNQEHAGTNQSPYSKQNFKKTLKNNSHARNHKHSYSTSENCFMSGSTWYGSQQSQGKREGRSWKNFISQDVNQFYDYLTRGEQKNNKLYAQKIKINRGHQKEEMNSQNIKHCKISTLTFPGREQSRQQEKDRSKSKLKLRSLMIERQEQRMSKKYSTIEQYMINNISQYTNSQQQSRQEKTQVIDKQRRGELNQKELCKLYCSQLLNTEKPCLHLSSYSQLCGDTIKSFNDNCQSQNANITFVENHSLHTELNKDLTSQQQRHGRQRIKSNQNFNQNRNSEINKIDDEHKIRQKQRLKLRKLRLKTDGICQKDKESSAGNAISQNQFRAKHKRYQSNCHEYQVQYYEQSGQTRISSYLNKKNEEQIDPQARSWPKKRLSQIQKTNQQSQTIIKGVHSGYGTIVINNYIGQGPLTNPDRFKIRKIQSITIYPQLKQIVQKSKQKQQDAQQLQTQLEQLINFSRKMNQKNQKISNKSQRLQQDSNYMQKSQGKCQNIIESQQNRFSINVSSSNQNKLQSYKQSQSSYHKELKQAQRLYLLNKFIQHYQSIHDLQF